MKRFHLFLLVGLILSIVLVSLPVMAAPAAADGDPGEESHVARRLIVKFKPGTDAATRQKVHGRHGGAVSGQIPQSGVEIVTLPAGRLPDQARAYRSEQAVEYAEPDYIAQAFEVGPDPYLSEQWGMGAIQAPAAWNLSDGNGIPVAILDTGVDANHPDLQGKIVNSKDFTGTGSSDDGNGHGTHVAGIAAAVTNNALGVAGVGYACPIMNGKVLDNSGSGAYSWIATGIYWAADNGAKVINMSLGGRFPSTLLQEAISYAWGKGVVIVASAGNNGNSKANYPAYYSPCIAVAATDANDSKPSFSTYGDWVDVAAPGLDIFSTLPNHSNTIGLNYGTLSGTSMASPHVAGLAALVWDSEFGVSNTSVRSRIEQTAEQKGAIWTSYGIPRINAYKAVSPTSVVVEPLALSNLAVTTAATTARITWRTNRQADTRIDFGLTTAYNAPGSPVFSAAPTTAHAVDLTGLDRASTYYYKVTSTAEGETVTATGSFKTKRK